MLPDKKEVEEAIKNIRGYRDTLAALGKDIPTHIDTILSILTAYSQGQLVEPASEDKRVAKIVEENLTYKHYCSQLKEACREILKFEEPALANKIKPQVTAEWLDAIMGTLIDDCFVRYTGLEAMNEFKCAILKAVKE